MIKGLPDLRRHTMDVESVIDVSQQIKNRLVAEAAEGAIDDICPFVIFERDGELIAIAHAPQVDRDMGLDILYAGAQGYAADKVTLVVDAHYSNSPTNPTTGEAWGPNEMQNACDHEGACDIGVTTDCLVIMACDRTREMTYTNLPYHVDKNARTVHWLPDEREQNLGSFRGLIPDVMRQAMALPSLPVKDVNRSWADAATSVALMARVGALILLASEMTKDELATMVESVGAVKGADEFIDDLEDQDG